MRSALGIGVLVGGLALAACTSSPPAPQGTLAGRMVASGGPAPGTVRPVAGAVVAVSAAGKTKTAVVGASGQFVLSVPVGTYTLVGTSGGSADNCASHGKSLVRASTVTTVQVVCPVP